MVDDTPGLGTEVDETLARLRASIDNIDAALVHLLAERFKITKAVGEHKRAVGLPPADPGREQVQIARLRRLAEDAGLDPAFSERMLRFIVDAVIRDYARIGVPEPRDR
jgi:chorismate mutase